MKEILKNWATLRANIKSLNEKKLAELLELEKKDGKRISFLLAIYGRMNILRTQRERAELISKSGD